MNIIYAALVRIISQRPNLNRFAMNGALYERDKIYVSLVIKKSLTDDGPETPVKLDFNGDERICDGYYYASSFKLLSKYLKKPELLEKEIERFRSVVERGASYFFEIAQKGEIQSA